MTPFVQDLENPCYTLSKDTEVDCEGRLSKVYMVAASTQPWESGYLSDSSREIGLRGIKKGVATTGFKSLKKIENTAKCFG